MRDPRHPIEHRIDWRRVLYWPTNRHYAIPWLVGGAVFPALAAVGVAGGKPPSLGYVPATLAGYVLVLALVLVFNAVLFWVHVRPQFLTWPMARCPFFGTYIMLTLAYIFLWGLLQMITGRAELVLGNGVDPAFTLHNLILGVAGLTPALLASSLWKSEEPGVTNLQVARENVIRLLRDLLDGRLQEGEHRALGQALRVIATDADTLQGCLRLEEEYRLLQVWKRAADSLKAEVLDTAYEDLMSRRERLKSSFESMLGELKKDTLSGEQR